LYLFRKIARKIWWRNEVRANGTSKDRQHTQAPVAPERDCQQWRAETPLVPYLYRKAAILNVSLGHRYEYAPTIYSPNLGSSSHPEEDNIAWSHNSVAF
jgi:hypothetical protein